MKWLLLFVSLIYAGEYCSTESVGQFAGSNCPAFCVVTDSAVMNTYYTFPGCYGMRIAELIDVFPYGIDSFPAIDKSESEIYNGGRLYNSYNGGYHYWSDDYVTIKFPLEWSWVLDAITFDTAIRSNRVIIKSKAVKVKQYYLVNGRQMNKTVAVKQIKMKVGW